MSTKRALLWLRQDLRLEDHPGFVRGAEAEVLLPVVILSPSLTGTCPLSGLDRCGSHRARFLLETLEDLRERLQQLSSGLLVQVGEPAAILPALAVAMRATEILAGLEPCAEEQAELLAVQQALNKQGGAISLHATHQRTLLEPSDLPFALEEVPPVFSRFRRKVEKKFGRGLAWPEPIPAPRLLPPLPGSLAQLAQVSIDIANAGDGWDWLTTRAANVYDDVRGAIRIRGGETAATRRLAQWVWEDDHLKRYKKTRNGLLGSDFSSRLSPWLANGSISSRTIAATIRAYENQRVANEDTYWLLFELLWRDYFQFLAWQHPDGLFWPQGTENGAQALPAPEPDPQLWQDWRRGHVAARLKDAFVAANLQELAGTGWMSNRGRQNVASYWVHDLGMDWRWGAAWFEHCLIDFDPASNSGNWLSILGGTPDPREGRRFNLQRQAWTYDRQQRYREHWLGHGIFTIDR